MTEYRVVNSSPLITLAKIGRLDLLEGPGVSVVIPAPVAQEVARWPKEDPARKALAAAGAASRWSSRRPRTCWNGASAWARAVSSHSRGR